MQKQIHGRRIFGFVILVYYICKYMNRFTSIFLSLIFVLYLGGIQLMYWIRIDAARQDANAYVQKTLPENINSKELILTASQYSSLQWLEKNKECVINGQRYDIIGVTHSAEGVKLKCYTDNEETEVANAFEHFAERLFNTPRPMEDHSFS